MGLMDDAERFEPASVEEWSDWLERNHDTCTGVWLVTPRRASSPPTVDYDSAVVEALRFGWVDATVRPLDKERAMQWFCPRRPGSGWARSNKERIERLRAEGRLERRGSGRSGSRRRTAPGRCTTTWRPSSCLRTSRARSGSRAGARPAWDGFSPSARKLMLTWLVQAKRAETRERRIREIAGRRGRGERAR